MTSEYEIPLIIDLALARQLRQQRPVPRDTATVVPAMWPIPQEMMPAPPSRRPLARGLGGFAASMAQRGIEMAQAARAQMEEEERRRREQELQIRQAQNRDMAANLQQLQAQAVQRDAQGVKEAEDIEQAAGEQLGAALQGVADTQQPPEQRRVAEAVGGAGEMVKGLMDLIAQGLDERQRERAPPPVPTVPPTEAETAEWARGRAEAIEAGLAPGFPDIGRGAWRAVTYPYEKTREFLATSLEPLRELTLAFASPGLTTEEKQAILKAFGEAPYGRPFMSEAGRERLAEVEPLEPEGRLENVLAASYAAGVEESAAILDPLNLVPILGFTTVDDLARAATRLRNLSKSPAVREQAGRLLDNIAVGARRLATEEAGMVGKPRGIPNVQPEAKAVVTRALNRMSPEVRAVVESKVRGVRVSASEELAEVGGHFDIHSRQALLPKGELTEETALHELLHAYVDEISDPAFIEAYIRARYPAEQAAKLLKDKPANVLYGYFGHENLTNSLTSYFLRKKGLPPRVSKVLDERLSKVRLRDMPSVPEAGMARVPGEAVPEARVAAEAAAPKIRVVPSELAERYQPMPRRAGVRPEETYEGALRRVSAKEAPPGVEPPPIPPTAGGPRPLIEGGKPPSLNLWRTLEKAHTRPDFLRRAAETLYERGHFIPGLQRVVRTVHGPAAIARIDPAYRAGFVYRLMEDVQASELAQRMARFEADYGRLWTVNDKSEALIGGKWIAFGDLAENPGRYALAGEQRTWLEDGWGLIDDVASQYTEVTGRKFAVELPREHYWPRFTVDEYGRAYVRARVGARQSPVRTRIFEEMADGIEEGIPYAGPLEGLRLYGRAIQKMTRDDLLKQVVRKDKIGRTVTQAHEQAIRALRDRAAALPEGSPERIKLIERAVKFEEAQARILVPKRGEVLGMEIGPAFTQTVFPRQTIRKIMGPLGRGQGWLRGAEMVAAVPRMLITGLADVGQWFIQGYALAVSNSPAWGRAVGRSLQAMFGPRNYARWIAENPAVKRASQYGVDTSLGSEFVEAARPTGLLGRLPTPAGAIPRAVQRGFDGFLVAGRVYKFDSMADVVLRVEGEEGLYRLARYSNTMLGTPSTRGLGISTTQRQVENAFVFFSARYTRSVPGFMAYALGNGVLAADARIVLGKMLFSGAAGFYGLARAAGLSHEEVLARLNPQAGGRFLSIPIGGNEVGIGGAYRAALGFAGALTAYDNWKFDSWDEALKDNPITRYLRSRTSPLTGTLIDLVTGEDFLGYPIGLDAIAEKPERLWNYFLDQVTPLNIDAMIEARGPWWMRTIVGLTETLGGRAYPAGPSSIMEDMIGDAVEQGLIGPGTTRPAAGDTPKRSGDLLPEERLIMQEQVEGFTDMEEEAQERRVARRSPFAELDRIAQERQDDVGELGRRLQAGEITHPEYREGRSAIIREIAAKRDEARELLGIKDRQPDTREQQVLDGYYQQVVKAAIDPVTGEIDSEKFAAAETAYRAQLEPEYQELLDRQLLVSGDPVERQYKQDMRAISDNGYWDINDDIVRRLVAEGRIPQTYKGSPITSFADFEDAMRDLALMRQVRYDSFDRWKDVDGEISDERIGFREQNPSIDALLAIWYDRTPRTQEASKIVWDRIQVEVPPVEAPGGPPRQPTQPRAPRQPSAVR